jgi:hypothetical protein
MTAAKQLKSYVERIEELDRQVAALEDEKSDIFDEARFAGIDVKALKATIRYCASHRGVAPNPVELYSALSRSPHVSPAEAFATVEPQKGWVYFSHFATSARLKIGFTSNVRQRLKALNSAAGEQGVLLAMLPGDRGLELRCLMAFAAWRLQGEWFNYTPECESHLRSFLKKFDAVSETAA